LQLLKQRFELDTESHVTRRHHVLGLEAGEVDFECNSFAFGRAMLLSGAHLWTPIQHLLDSLLKYFTGLHGPLLRLSTRDNYLAFCKDEGGRFGLADSHNDGGELAWVILSIATAHIDFAQVKLAAIEISSGDKICQSVLGLRRLV